jgi:2-polyprenyl-3-methyl-5-hydroxy-6-metoxy-1,4-benzoquinol methylase
MCGGALRPLSVFEVPTRVLHCQACKVERLDPLPDTSQLEAAYTDYKTTHTDAGQMAQLIEMWKPALEGHLINAGFARSSWSALSFLDAGCGNGASVLAAAQLGLGSVHGIDMDRPAMERLSERIARDGLRATSEHATLNDLQARSMRFDVIKLSQVIEHVHDPIGLLRSAHAVLADGGVLIIDCPNNAAAFWMIKNALRKRYRRMAFYNSLELGEHIWGFTREGLTQALQRAGFQDITCKDYSIRDVRYQPEAGLWYPTVLQGVRSSLRERRAYHVLKAAIPVFDQLAHACGMGIGLVAVARKNRAS